MKKRNIILLILILVLSFTFSCGPNGSDNNPNETNDTIVNNDTENNTTVEEEKSGINIWTAIFSILLAGGLAVATYYIFKKWIPLGTWYKAWLSGVRVSWLRLIKMFWRGISQEKILLLLIQAKNANLELATKELENALLAEIDIEKIVHALIKGRNSHLDITFEELSQQALAKVDIDILLEALIIAKNVDIDTNIAELSTLYHSKVDIIRVINAKKTAKNSGFPVKFHDLSEHFLAGGHIEKTVEAYVAACKANISNFEFEDIANIDLAGYDVINTVHRAISPFVVETDSVRGIARDGVELTMKLKVTLRAFIKHIIGGADENTVLARVNEGLATQIGLSESHYRILESPYELARKVHEKGLHESSAFEIISVDVSDIQVGKDVHSELKIERAHADAEKAKAELIKAEEKVKKAMAAAFLDGKMSINEYHNMMNTEADTEMRKKLGKSVEKEELHGNHHNNEHHDEHKGENHDEHH